MRQSSGIKEDWQFNQLHDADNFETSKKIIGEDSLAPFNSQANKNNLGIRPRRFSHN